MINQLMLERNVEPTFDSGTNRHDLGIHLSYDPETINMLYG